MHRVLFINIMSINPLFCAIFIYKSQDILQRRPITCNKKPFDSTVNTFSEQKVGLDNYSNLRETFHRPISDKI